MLRVLKIIRALIFKIPIFRPHPYQSDSQGEAQLLVLVRGSPMQLASYLSWETCHGLPGITPPCCVSLCLLEPCYCPPIRIYQQLSSLRTIRRVCIPREAGWTWSWPLGIFVEDCHSTRLTQNVSIPDDYVVRIH